MKLILLIFPLLILSCGEIQKQIPQQYSEIVERLKHIPADSEGSAYKELNEKYLNESDYGNLAFVMKLGKRNLEWLDLINKTRSVKLSIYDVNTTTGISIDRPSHNNRALVLKRLSKAERNFDSYFKKYLFGNTLPSKIEISDIVFIKNLRVMDLIYQSASRWLQQESVMIIYSNLRRNDIQGYYHLNKIENLPEQLLKYNSLTEETRVQYKEWLMGQCHNSQKSLSICEKEFKYHMRRWGHPRGFYYTYVEIAEKLYKSFFSIGGKRAEFHWSNNILIAPMKIQEIKIKDWLTKNIEDEWRGSNWNLELSFSNAGLVDVVLKAGATPNVNGLGGNKITMDANRGINNYLTDWTIRHEFGHVLGFKDCYIEFYHSQKKVMVNYQLDVDDIMCSRRGHIKERHHQELRKAYQ